MILFTIVVTVFKCKVLGTIIMKSISCFAILLAILTYPVYVNATIIVYDTSIYAEVISKTSKNDIVTKKYQGSGDVHIDLNEYVNQGGGYASITTGKYALEANYPSLDSIFQSTVVLDNSWWFRDDVLETETHPSAGAALFATSMFTVTDSNASVELRSYSINFQTYYSVSLQDLTTSENIFSSNNDYFIHDTKELLADHSYGLYISYLVPLTTSIADTGTTFEIYSRDTDVQIGVPTPPSFGIMCIGLMGLIFTNRRRIF